MERQRGERGEGGREREGRGGEGERGVRDSSKCDTQFLIHPRDDTNSDESPGLENTRKTV